MFLSDNGSDASVALPAIGTIPGKGEDKCPYFIKIIFLVSVAVGVESL